MDSARASWARVGYQGEPGAYSEEAALAILPAAVTVGFPTFSRAFDAVADRDDIEDIDRHFPYILRHRRFSRN